MEKTKMNKKKTSKKEEEDVLFFSPSFWSWSEFKKREREKKTINYLPLKKLIRLSFTIK